MRYSKLQNVFELHIITAAEAAYNTLFGLFLPQRGVIWVGAINQIVNQEEWLIDSAEVDLTDATGLHYQGRQINLGAIYQDKQGQCSLPVSQWTNLGKSVRLLHPVTTLYGLAVWVRTPSFIATDIIQVKFSYRRVTNE
jgi:hypothetical protein